MALPASTKTPQVRASIIFGSAGATPSNAPKRILLIGSKIGSDITTTINQIGMGHDFYVPTYNGERPVEVETLNMGGAAGRR
jgi:hypothetical protein